MKQQATPATAIVNVIKTMPGDTLAVYGLVSETDLPGKLRDDSVHDHQEFDPDTPPATEYSTGGSSISLSPFTSVPGAARPGMACPGMV